MATNPKIKPETDWKLLAVQRGIDLDICETALREIAENTPTAMCAIERAEEALALLAESKKS